MSQEWYEYAISIKKRTDNKLKKASSFMTYLILVVFSLPLLKYNVWYWLILTISYCLFLFYISKEKDNYAKALCDIAITIIIIGLELLSMISISGTNIIPAIIYTIIGITSYEILVSIKIRKQAYSVYTNEKSKKEKHLVSSGVVIGCGLGYFLVRKHSPSLLFFLLSLVSAMLFVVAIVFFQRYVIYKIINTQFNPKE